MKYENMVEGTFIERPNRFIAHALINENMEVCHVKNTGRCKELLIPGSKVYLEKNNNSNRKTKYSLISVNKSGRLINMDSNAPNKAVHEWLKEGNLFSDITLIRPETKYNNSRFDFYVEHGNKKTFIEVKGVTLEEDGIVRFPDAPTIRGVKHIYELCEAKKDGYEAYVIFVIQMKDVKYFMPNYSTHKEFGDALIEARKSGVQILAFDCQVTKESMKLSDEVEVKL
ncbi:sugar fermentation stimulation protein A [Mobilisporobacter senegalensis]|uniref:Sugar fermentation stimulation protein homolog n=1 Tax=Mobilisporobacter senegalensis TaxID=1329262 RepID=A0A3N1XU72_9FIRM|nr:DNA/RNA nuclease SfsA [Mobilisporobacter senegalensis]ROR28732.1 sugar fermentation stimulation protein A [Mobilisporobacter senegalensis]